MVKLSNMLSTVYSGAVVGLEGVLIEVEVDVASHGFPTFTIVGLPTKAVDEAKHRVRAAIINKNLQMPDSRITVNLAPADLPKEGSSFDLPIAIGILAASGAIDREPLKNSLFIGELSLEGGVRKVPGIVPVAILAREKKIRNLFVPYQNRDEAAIIKQINVYPVKNFEELILHLNGHKFIQKYQNHKETKVPADDQEDFSDVRGQEHAKRALQIAASGMHNVHLKGPPGTGKTMLSRLLTSIMPSLDTQESIEVSKIYSACGLLKGNELMARRPFRAPHHTISRVGLVGGGPDPTPGEITLAHRGVLFLDEFSEFPRGVLESLRQPLEDGLITISRAAGSLTFPCRFTLIAASNPCPCGYLGHPKRSCRCSPGAILRYKKRLSGPILDRIDLHVTVASLDENKLTKLPEAPTTEKIRLKVQEAYDRQRRRFKELKISSNNQMSPSEIRKFCTLTNTATELLKEAISRLSLSARAYFKTIKIAQTLADMGDCDRIEKEYIAEALQFRTHDE